MKKLLLVFLTVVPAIALNIAWAASQRPDSKPDPTEIKLTPEVVQSIKDLSASFKEANTSRAFYQAQVEKADARLAEINARLVAEFNHFAAKSKIDPDEYEFTEDMTGIRKKKKAPTP